MMHRKQKGEAIWGLGEPRVDDKPKAREPLDKGKIMCDLQNVGVSIKCGYKQFITFQG
jgi:hypothetical protein